MKRYRIEIAFDLTERLLPNTVIANKIAELGFSDVTVEGSGRNYVIEGTWDLHDAKITLKEIPIDRSKSNFSLAALLQGLGDAKELQPPKKSPSKGSKKKRNKWRKG